MCIPDLIGLKVISRKLCLTVTNKKIIEQQGVSEGSFRNRILVGVWTSVQSTVLVSLTFPDSRTW